MNRHCLETEIGGIFTSILCSACLNFSPPAQPPTDDEGADADVDADTDVDTDADTDTDTDTDTDNDTDTDTDSNSDTGAEHPTDSTNPSDSSDTGPDADTDTDPATCESICEDDGFACTDDLCANEKCVHPVKDGFCLIDGQCYSHNENDPENECRYCDSTINALEWTNWPKTVGCDDGLWCNGSENCDGKGTCEHDYPDSKRCLSGSGACDSSTCTEEFHCYASDDTVCDSWEEYRCNGEGCGAVAESRTVTQYCSGASSACDGSAGNDGWEYVKSCNGDKLCSSDASGASCESALECVSWYDSATGLYWQDPPSETGMNWYDADDYCSTGAWGGFDDWRLPNIAELISLLRGCRNGTETGNLSLTQCSMTPAGCGANDNCTDLNDCSFCDVSEGPDNDPDGCYWEPALKGECSWYWSSSSYAGNSSSAWHVYFNFGSVNDYDKAGTLYVRCVRGGS